MRTTLIALLFLALTGCMTMRHQRRAPCRAAQWDRVAEGRFRSFRAPEPAPTLAPDADECLDGT